MFVNKEFFESRILSSGQPSGELQMKPEGYLSFEIIPTGGNVTGLKIQQQLHENGPYEDDLVDADFASGTIVEVIRASAVPPNATTNGNTGWAKLRLGLVRGIRFIPTLSAGTCVIRGIRY